MTKRLSWHYIAPTDGPIVIAIGDRVVELRDDGQIVPLDGEAFDPDLAAWLVVDVARVEAEYDIALATYDCPDPAYRGCWEAA